jgi:hypothetical protein
MGPARRLPLRPFEIAALGFALLGLGGLALLGLAPGLDSGARQVRITLGVLALSLPLGVGTQAAWRLVSRRPVRAYLRSASAAPWLWLWVRLWAACMLTSFVYFWLKVCVPLIHAQRFDEPLWRLDRLLHLGVSPTFLLQGVLPASGALRALDYWYGLWLVTLVVGISFFAASADATLRRGVVLSCILVWAAGACLYAALPALGPIYAFPSAFEALPAEMPIAAAQQELLWSNYERVTGLAQGRADHTRGVAALPSLHVAFHALFAFWAARSARDLLPVFALAALFTFVASVRTGWHYALDGYVGIAIAWLAYRAACAMEGVAPRESSD